MTLLTDYREARRSEDIARLRRLLALRAMAASGMSQREIGVALGISQPAVSQQLRATQDLAAAPPDVLLEAGAPVLTSLADESGFARLAVFGSIARGQGRPDSDIDLLVRAPRGTSSFGFVRFKQLLERVLGREIDLVEYGGLRPGEDDDILKDAVPL